MFATVLRCYVEGFVVLKFDYTKQTDNHNKDKSTPELDDGKTYLLEIFSRKLLLTEEFYFGNLT